MKRVFGSAMLISVAGAGVLASRLTSVFGRGDDDELSTRAKCAVCREVPVLAPGDECGKCRYTRAVAQAISAAIPPALCPLCKKHQTPIRQQPCAVCITKFRRELDSKGVTW